MSFQSKLKELRLKKKLTQQDVADKLGITRQAYGYYESDKSKREPDISSIQKLAELFDVSTDYLISGKEYSNSGLKLPELNSKDEKDIAKRLDEIKNDIEHADGLAFDGEPMSDEAKDSFMDAMEFILQQTKKINKKYTPKKYRKDED